jgi:hypothetical protein
VGNILRECFMVRGVDRNRLKKTSKMREYRSKCGTMKHCGLRLFGKRLEDIFDQKWRVDLED